MKRPGLPSRRTLLLGGGVLAAGAWLRPVDRSGARDGYFTRLQLALKEAGIATPTLVVDRQRLDANIARLKADLPIGMGYRIVAKSLPSPDLVAHVRAGTGTDRLMTFNLPMLLAFARAMPDAGQLLGKPMPAAAVRSFFDQLPATSAEAASRITWLVDTPERLDQYAALARATGQQLAVAIELDVGFHRGGQAPGAGLAAMLSRLQGNDALRLAGTMGYDPHIPSVPTLLGWQDRVIAHAWTTYQAAKAQIRETLGATALEGAILNAAGSPTYRLYRDTAVANEVSVGSALVKPMDFDKPLLEVHQPACFIAAPVLKRGATELPFGFGAVNALQRLWDPNTRQTVFTYGGHWLARPVDPPGLQYNGLFGRSSNQEMLNAGAGLALVPDDFVFFRPTQSEAVFLQFGDIAVFDGRAIVDHWPVLAATA